LRRIVGGMLRNEKVPGPQTADASPGIPAPAAARRLVRDPVCGVHVDETLSIPLREGGELLHFCSPLAAMRTPSTPGSLRQTDKQFSLKRILNIGQVKTEFLRQIE